MRGCGRLIGGCLLLVFAVLPRIVQGHATTYRMLDNDSAVVVQFGFVDGSPMRTADVTVFAPSDSEHAYQSGRTDLNGRFAFYPSAPGEWRVRANDGIGHLQVVAVTIAADAQTEAHMGETQHHDHESLGHHHHDHHHHDHHHDDDHDDLVRLIFGLSIILNIFLGGYVYRLSRK